ncbi:hypothetical protein AU193_13765 [Mycobacterium sp. GA-1285]|uniref:hypothetical protein n=1 Tax=Mycobacterium sp. GA-1285 TaxID=1772282 RepID=UPI00074AF2E5|nr:hypothetical protein [Mycobacterium sp. GA-1285]KUI21625.1 hypothetical protein AU193_13765 [Mycobacterium sp. GA-1285]
MPLRPGLGGRLEAPVGCRHGTGPHAATVGRRLGSGRIRALLAEQGIKALKLDALCERAGATKGRRPANERHLEIAGALRLGMKVSRTAMV